MKIYNSLAEVPSILNAALTIGTFDGLHVGHRQILNRLMEEKYKITGESIAFTFLNHPFEVLFPDRIPKKLGTLDFKIDFFRKIKIDHLILIKFTHDFANVSHIQFIEDIKKPFNNLTLVLGDNFKFGKNNLGDIHYLEHSQEKFGFNLVQVKQILSDGKRASSSIIRKLIEENGIEIANQLLKREYFIEGTCMEGDQQGRKIGYPTINILDDDSAHPKYGVYKTKTEVNGKMYSSMTFIGRKSLSKNKDQIYGIESYLFDFNENVYNENVKIFFQKRIRDEMQFKSLNELKIQLDQDKIKACLLDEEFSVYPK